MCNNRLKINVLLIAGVVLSVLATAHAKQENYAVAREDGVPVFQSRGNVGESEPFFSLENEERVVVLGIRGAAMKIRDSEGRDGWVSSEKVKIIRKSATYSFDDAEVMGHLDDPTSFFILDSEAPEEEVLNLNRSFKPLLKNNLDQYTVERINEIEEKG